MANFPKKQETEVDFFQKLQVLKVFYQKVSKIWPIFLKTGNVSGFSSIFDLTLKDAGGGGESTLRSGDGLPFLKE